MIEDIQLLRKAARITPEEKDEKVWCIVSGNDLLVDDMAYEAIASKDKVKILFREHIVLKEGRVSKKFDFMMLSGFSSKVLKLQKMCKDKGGAFILIRPSFLSKKPNLMALIAPDDVIRKSVSSIGRNKIPFEILLEDQTTGFIEVDLNFKLPTFIKSALRPLYDVSDVVLSTILISVDNDDDVEKVQSIVTSNKVFVIDFRDIVMEE